jgi:GNAT superfamily N-acetyltransferase
VSREAQGRGLGRRFLGIVVDWARQNGFSTISLATFRGIPWNGPFYAAVGFRDWPADEAPAAVRAALAREAAMGLIDRCAMRLIL